MLVSDVCLTIGYQDIWVSEDVVCTQKILVSVGKCVIKQWNGVPYGPMVPYFPGCWKRVAPNGWHTPVLCSNDLFLTWMITWCPPKQKTWFFFQQGQKGLFNPIGQIQCQRLLEIWSSSFRPPRGQESETSWCERRLQPMPQGVPSHAGLYPISNLSQGHMNISYELHVHHVFPAFPSLGCFLNRFCKCWLCTNCTHSPTFISLLSIAYETAWFHARNDPEFKGSYPIVYLALDPFFAATPTQTWRASWRIPMGKSLITWVMFQPRSWVSHEWPPIKNHSKIPFSMAMLVITRGYFLPMNIPSIDHKK